MACKLTPVVQTRISPCRAGISRRHFAAARSRSPCCQCLRDKEPGDFLTNAGDCPVPKAQQPMFELKQLQEEEIFKWAALPLPEFITRLILVYAGFFVFIALPVSAASFNFSTEPVQFVVAASIGSWLVVTVTLLRLYLGYSFVGNRLLSATVEYEETGWYDGAVWTKSPQMLMRDRLLCNYSVKPVIERLKASLVSCGAGAVLSAFLLASWPTASANAESPLTPTYRSGEAEQMQDYWEAVDKYEPWSVTEDTPRPSSIMDHMLVR